MNAPLKSVSFRPARQPRISAKRAPGRRSEKWWGDDEIALLRKYYPKGMRACLAHLPGRTQGGIQTKAHALRIKGPMGGGVKPRVQVPDDIDDRIRAGWAEFTGKKGEVAALANKLGLRRHWLTVRATKLQLVQPFHKEPPWTAAELTLLKKAPLHNLDKAAQVFRTHGFRRSPTAIAMKARKVGVSRRYTETLSATAAAKILGVDSKAITSCCIDGSLKATRRNTKRLNQQGGDAWSIERAEFKRYILDNLGRIDIRKVDKFAFADLLTRTHKKRSPWSADEDTIIKDGYRRKLGPAQIADALQDAGFQERGISSVSLRAKELGVRPTHRSDTWTPEEDAILRREYAAKTRLIDIVGELAEAGFTRHRGAVQMRAIALGLGAKLPAALSNFAISVVEKMYGLARWW